MHCVHPIHPTNPIHSTNQSTPISSNRAACISCSTVRRSRALRRSYTDHRNRQNAWFSGGNSELSSAIPPSRAAYSAACRRWPGRIPGQGRFHAFFAFGEENRTDRTPFTVLSLRKDHEYFLSMRWSSERAQGCGHPFLRRLQILREFFQGIEHGRGVVTERLQRFHRVLIVLVPHVVAFH